MNDRGSRSQTAKRKKIESLSTSTVGHSGIDVSAPIRKAQDQGGSLDETSRKKMKGDIARDKNFAPKLSGLMHQDFASHILEHRISGKVVSQVDNRIDPRKGGAYMGHMFSSTRVSPNSFDPSLKEIGEPMSPNPYSGSGSVHRAHTTPFGLGGIETNATRTVNAPSWANITVDSFIESKAKKSAAKYGDGSTFHFRFDTHDRSSVGYAVDRGKAVDSDKRWKTVVAQYQRKLGDGDW